MNTRIEGCTIPFSIDLAILGTITKFELRYFKNTPKNTVVKFSYPAATDFTTATLDGTTYSVLIPSTITLPGVYGVEILAVVGTETIKKQVMTDTINPKATT